MAKTIKGSIVSLDGFIADDNRHFLERLGLLLGGRDPPRCCRAGLVVGQPHRPERGARPAGFPT